MCLLNSAAVCVCVCVFSSLTVDSEADGSTQVSFHVIEIYGRALVHAFVCALDRFQRQETTLTADGLFLKVEEHEGGEQFYRKVGIHGAKAGKPTQFLSQTSVCVQEMHTYVFGEVKLRLRVPISLTLHGNRVALFDRIIAE